MDRRNSKNFKVVRADEYSGQQNEQGGGTNKLSGSSTIDFLLAGLSNEMSSIDEHSDNSPIQERLQLVLDETNRSFEVVLNDIPGIEVGGIYLPDRIWFNIYSFMYNTEISRDNYSRWDEEPVGLPCLFRKLSYVSHAFYESLIRYVQQKPVKLGAAVFCSKKIYEAIAWACWSNVKLGSFSLRICGGIHSAIFKCVLTSCNITELHECVLLVEDDYINDVSIPQVLTNQIESKAAEVGTTFPEDSLFATSVESQRFFAEYVPTRAISLKSMVISVYKENLHLPVLTSLCHSLEDLELLIYSTDNDTRDHADLQDISGAIGQMTGLKKLKICGFVPGPFHIHSTSLEEIDITCSTGDFFIDKCVCPALKVFKCRYFIGAVAVPNGLNHVKIPFTKEEVQKMKPKNGIVEVESGSRAFIGMRVPKTCIVSIVLCMI